ncbi:MAG: hypothetical protein AB1514_15060, partial [Pseudomonadota bacterium]
PCISLETAEKLSSELRIGNGSTLGGRKNRAAHPVVFKGVASLLLIFLVEGSNPSRPTNAINDPSHSKRYRSAVPFVLLPAKCLFRLGAARPRRLAFGGCLRGDRCGVGGSIRRAFRCRTIRIEPRLPLGAVGAFQFQRGKETVWMLRRTRLLYQLHSMIGQPGLDIAQQAIGIRYGCSGAASQRGNDHDIQHTNLLVGFDGTRYRPARPQYGPVCGTG